MAEILFTHSYFLRFDPKELRAMTPYPPLGTLYAAGMARAQGYSVALFDSMLAENEDGILPLLQAHRPSVVVIYDDDFNYLTKMCLSRMRQAAFTLTSHAKASGATVVVHGSDPVDHLDKYLGHGADYVLCGEGEATLIELLGYLCHGQGHPSQIEGLGYLDGGAVVRTAKRRPLRELDALPSPARDLIDMERYRDLWKSRHGYFSLNMVTTRGCPYHCNWCAKPLYGQVYNTRAPGLVADEMKRIKENYHPDHIWFCDDIFGLKPGWIAAFADAVLEQDAMIPFRCLARADLLLQHDTIEQLRRAGCESVWIGAESGSQKILDAMEKGTTVGQIYEATRRLRQAGIKVGFFLQYGYPGEAAEDIALTLRMVRECLPDDIGISVSYPLPGTRFFESVRGQLGAKRNWVDSEDLAMMYHGTFPADYYRVLHKVTHKHFRIWQTRALLRRMLREPSLLTAQGIRKVAAAIYHALTLPALERRLAATAKG